MSNVGEAPPPNRVDSPGFNWLTYNAKYSLSHCDISSISSSVIGDSSVSPLDCVTLIVYFNLVSFRLAYVLTVSQAQSLVNS